MGLDSGGMQPSCAAKIRQVDNEKCPFDYSTGIAHKLSSRAGCPPGGEQIIDDHYALAGADSTGIEFKPVPAVFECIFNRDRWNRELAGLANRNERQAQIGGNRGAKNETPRLDPYNGLRIIAGRTLRQPIDNRSETDTVAYQSGHIPIEDP